MTKTLDFFGKTWYNLKHRFTIRLQNYLKTFKNFRGGLNAKTINGGIDMRADLIGDVGYGFRDGVFGRAGYRVIL